MQERLFIGLAVSAGHVIVMMCLLHQQPAPNIPVRMQQVMVRFEGVPTSMSTTPAPAQPSPQVQAEAQAARPNRSLEAPRMSDVPETTSTATASNSHPAPSEAQPPLNASPSGHHTTSTSEAPLPASSPPQTVSISAVQYARQPIRDYPRAALLRGDEGSVGMKVLVNKDGLPEAVQITRSSGHEALDRAAVQSMKTSLFKPYLVDGKPQSVWVLTTLDYHLEAAP